MIEKIEKTIFTDVNNRADYKIQTVVEKLNELIDEYNKHVHYARELQFPTAGPDDPNPYKS